MNQQTANMGLVFDAQYGHPFEIIFGSKLYRNVFANLGFAEEFNATVVVASTFKGQESTRSMETPDLVVFNLGLYQKTEADEGGGDEDTLKTVKADNLSSIYPDPRRFEIVSNPYPVDPYPAYTAQLRAEAQVQAQARAQARLAQNHRFSSPAAAPQPQPQAQSLHNSPQNLVPVNVPHSQKAMPPRTQVPNHEALEYLYDLPPHQRPAIDMIYPSRNNPDNEDGSVRKQRQGLSTEQKDYLEDLLHLAVLTVGRNLEVKDFKAITEALNRQFRGTNSNGVPYKEKGWNTLHSTICKDKSDAWGKFEARILA